MASIPEAVDSLKGSIKEALTPEQIIAACREAGHRWRDRTLDWFEKLKQEPGIEPVYITYADVCTFIDWAADRVGSCFADPISDRPE